MKLPGWVVDDATSIEREAKPYRGLSNVERTRILADLCRAAAKQLSFRANRAYLLDYQDPVPESTRQALARLRQLYRPTP
jgi:hypothetical protein